MEDRNEPLIKTITPEQLVKTMDSVIQLMAEFNNEVGRKALVSCGIRPIEEKRTLWFMVAGELTESEIKLLPAEYCGLPTRIIFQDNLKP